MTHLGVKMTFLCRGGYVEGAFWSFRRRVFRRHQRSESRHSPPVQRASKHSHNDNGRGVHVRTPRLVALSPEQEREAVALLGQLLLDVAGRRTAGVSDGVLGGAYPGAFGGATATPAMPGKAHRHT